MNSLQGELAKLRQDASLTKSIDDVENVIKQLTKARETIAADPNSAPITLATLQNPLISGFEKVNESLNRVHKAYARYGRALEKNFPLKTLPDDLDVLTSETKLINRAISMHLIREGQFSTARAFLSEALVEKKQEKGKEKENVTETPDEKFSNISEELKTEEIQQAFLNMYSILEELKNRNLHPAIRWAQQNSSRLEKLGSSIEFELCKLQYLWLFHGTEVNSLPDDENNGLIGALKYARANFPRHMVRFPKEAEQLVTALLYRPNIESSPYRQLIKSESAWEDIYSSFVRDFCLLLGLSPSSPLYLACTAGAIALPTLLKLADIVREKKTEWTTQSELPVEITLPKSMLYHAIFVCPVSKEQSTEKNPPMVMPCGHVLAKESLRRIMCDSHPEKGTGLWKLVPILTRENKDEWFCLVEQILEGENSEWLLTKTHKEYAHVLDSARLQAPEADWTSYTVTTKAGDKVKWWFVLEKDREYKKAQIQFILNIRLKINASDKDLIDEEEGGISVQFSTLKKRYDQITFTSGHNSIVAFTTWTMNTELSPSVNYSQLIKLRKKIQQFSPGTKFSSEFMWNIFVAGLRPREEYVALTEGFGDNMEGLERLTRLDEKWQRLQNMDTDKQQAFKAVSSSQNKFQAVPEQLVEQAFAARKSHNRSPSNLNCFKCGSNRHVSISCPYAEIGFDAARKARIRREGEESDEDTKVYQPPRSYITRSREHKSSLLPEDNFRSSNSNWRNGKSSSRPRLNSPRPHYHTEEQARLADEPSDDDSGTEIDEFGGLSWEQRSKIPPSAWAADSGCTSPMTDNENLFSSTVVPCRRRIQVGSGFFFSTAVGTATIILEDGKCISLANTLLVPGIGCNLLSVKKMVIGARCIGQFNSNFMTFLDPITKISLVEAKNHKGLYLVSKISNEADGSVFGEENVAINALKRCPEKKRVTFCDELKTYDPDTIVEFKSITNSRAKTPESITAFEASEEILTPHDPSVTCPDPKSNAYLDSKIPAYPYAEVDGGAYIRQSEFSNGVNKREQNAVIKNLRKIKAGPLNAHGSRNERRLQEEVSRYSYYHRRFCHASPQALSLLHTVCDIKKINIPERIPLCVICAAQKIKKKQSKKLAKHDLEPLALISFDVAGPFPPSYRGYRYFGEIVDNWNRKTWTLLLKDRKEILSALNKWRLKVELQTGMTVRASRTDNAPEIIQTLKQWENEGVSVQHTEPHTSAQNGPAERSIQFTEASIRCMLDDAKLPVEFWCEAAQAQAYTRARMRRGPIMVENIIDKKTGKPAKVEYRISPEEAFTRKVPRVHDHIKTWGCKVITQVPRASLPGRKDKFMPSGREGIFMGYSDDTTTHYRIYAPDMHTTITSSNVIFFEDIPGRSIANFRLWKELSEDFASEIQLSDSQDEIEHVPSTCSKDLDHKDVVNTATIIPKNEIVTDDKFSNEKPTKRQITASNDDEVSDDKPPKKRNKTTTCNFIKTAKNIPRGSLRSGTKRLREDDNSEEHVSKKIRAMIAMLDWFEEKHTAISDPNYGLKWKEAIDCEIKQLLENNTWREDVPPEGSTLVTSKWVFTVKLKPDGTIERFKARLVARGFSQQYDIDYTETFAPTVRMATLRTFLALVACEDLECYHYNIKNAFTESKLDEEIWMKVPKGIERTKPGIALRLMRSLYGLKQAARDWNHLIRSELINWGFVQSKADPCLFIHVERQIRLVYVDDLAAAAKQTLDLDWFFEKLNARFNAKNLGELIKILGVSVTRDRAAKTIELDQEQYLDKVLTKFGFAVPAHWEISIPMDNYNDLRKANPKDKRVYATWYREVIGSLMCAMVYTRPDIAFALGRLSQHMQDPAEHHASALKRLMRYLRFTIKAKIRFGPRGGLVTYSNADWASDRTDRKSITACVGLIGGGPVFWGSKKHNSVATATVEAEYIAPAYNAKQGQWIAQVLRDMGFGNYVARNHQTVEACGENQGAIAFTKNPHLTDRSKHIDISYHFVRDLHENKKIDLKYVPTTDMAADGFSKPLAKQQFNKWMRQIGMILVGQSGRASKNKVKDC
ncbi:hypothetical protein K3495_g4052 [Podosphaera aphanis]|nr:hypothetical protein K3495_g4052 [Podosphaera aphanis]